ncbi:hypothetical protein D3C71_77510 [compost metagenome]
MKIRYTAVKRLEVFTKVLQRLQTLQRDDDAEVMDVEVEMVNTNDEDIMFTFSTGPDDTGCFATVKWVGGRAPVNLYQANVHDNYLFTRDLRFEFDMSSPEEIESAVVKMSDHIHLLLTTPAAQT